MRSKGFEYENKAKNYLEKKGLRFIEQNYICKLGEIDLIMQDRNTIVFVEVRYRNTSKYGTALESITPSKVSKLRKTAKHYLMTQHKGTPPCRFDALTFDKTKTGTSISWVVSAFGEQHF